MRFQTVYRPTVRLLRTFASFSSNVLFQRLIVCCFIMSDTFKVLYTSRVCGGVEATMKVVLLLSLLRSPHVAHNALISVRFSELTKPSFSLVPI